VNLQHHETSPHGRRIAQMPDPLRLAFVGTFILFAIVNPDWKQIATAVIELGQVHVVDIQKLFQGSGGTGNIIGGLELLTGAFFVYGWRNAGPCALALAQLASLFALAVSLGMLFDRQELNLETFTSTGAFFVKDIALMAVTSAILAVTDL
jgi:hypothetical protein